MPRHTTPDIPRRTTQIDYEQVKEHAMDGFSAEQISALLRLDPSVVEDEQFVEAVEYWRLQGNCRLRGQLKKQSAEGKVSATRLLLMLGGWIPTSPSRAPAGWSRFLLHDAPEGSPETGS